jgi:hypothetical protein
MKAIVSLTAAILLVPGGGAQRRPPVIDVHLHALRAAGPGGWRTRHRGSSRRSKGDSVRRAVPGPPLQRADARERAREAPEASVSLPLNGRARLPEATGARYNRRFLHLLGGRSTVGHGALDAVIGVRIPASQPIPTRNPNSLFSTASWEFCFRPPSPASEQGLDRHIVQRPCHQHVGGDQRSSNPRQILCSNATCSTN